MKEKLAIAVVAFGAAFFILLLPVYAHVSGPAFDYSLECGGSLAALDRVWFRGNGVPAHREDIALFREMEKRQSDGCLSASLFPIGVSILEVFIGAAYLLLQPRLPHNKRLQPAGFAGG